MLFWSSLLALFGVVCIWLTPGNPPWTVPATTLVLFLGGLLHWWWRHRVGWLCLPIALVALAWAFRAEMTFELPYGARIGALFAAFGAGMLIATLICQRRPRPSVFKLPASLREPE